MPTAFKSVGATINSSTPQDVWTGASGVQTIATSITMSNRSGNTARVDLFLWNTTNGAKAIGSWLLDAVGTSSSSVCVDRLCLATGDKWQVASISSVNIDVTVNVAESS